MNKFSILGAVLGILLISGFGVAHAQVGYAGNHFKNWKNAYLPRTAKIVCGASLCGQSNANTKSIPSDDQKVINLAKQTEAKKAEELLRTYYSLDAGIINFK